MTTRAALVSGLVLLAALAIGLLLTTPWHPLGSTALQPNGHLDFTPAEFTRETAFHKAVRPPAYLSMLLGVLVACLLGFTHWGARLIEAVSGGRWWQGVLVGAAVCAALPRVASILADAVAEKALRAYGLSNQTWSGWAVDQAKSFALAVAITAPVLLGAVALARTFPRWWWVGAAALAALITVAVSFLYPVLVEPVFNSFTPLEAGPLKTSLLDLAREDGIGVRDVLVADASKRTTALNAYVSGIGSSRRIVVYDTLLKAATPQEVRLVVAHELSHVKHRDVLCGTLLGALAAAMGVCFLGAALQSSGLLSRAGARGAGDPKIVALVLALAVLATVISGPVLNLVSRRVETHADVGALDLTHDPATFIDTERRLALSNIASLGPNRIAYFLFSTHPSTSERIALARAWAVKHGMVPPAPTARVIPAR